MEMILMADNKGAVCSTVNRVIMMAEIKTGRGYVHLLQYHILVECTPHHSLQDMLKGVSARRLFE